jgi:hypothetical protein
MTIEGLTKTDEMKHAAIECLTKAFNGTETPSHIIQAATTVLCHLTAPILAK